jgi:hypothetical protein
VYKEVISLIAQRSQAPPVITLEEDECEAGDWLEDTFKNRQALQGQGITEEEIRLLNLLQVILDNGWVINQANLDESLRVAGVSLARVRQLQGASRDDARPSLASIFTARFLANKMGFNFTLQ